MSWCVLSATIFLSFLAARIGVGTAEFRLISSGVESRVFRFGLGRPSGRLGMKEKTMGERM